MRYPKAGLPDDPVILGSMAAMQRAAQMARDIAIQTDTAIVICQDGRIVWRTAAELRAERQQQDHNASAAATGR